MHLMTLDGGLKFISSLCERSPRELDFDLLRDFITDIVIICDGGRTEPYGEECSYIQQARIIIILIIDCSEVEKPRSKYHCSLFIFINIIFCIYLLSLRCTDRRHINLVPNCRCGWKQSEVPITPRLLGLRFSTIRFSGIR